MFHRIINPLNGRSYNLKSTIGKKILKNYIMILTGAAPEQTPDDDHSAREDTSGIAVRVRVGGEPGTVVAVATVEQSATPNRAAKTFPRCRVRLDSGGVVWTNLSDCYSL